MRLEYHKPTVEAIFKELEKHPHLCLDANLGEIDILGVELDNEQFMELRTMFGITNDGMLLTDKEIDEAMKK